MASGRAAQLRPAAQTCLTNTPGSGYAASTTCGAAPGADPPRFTQRRGGRTATGIASPVPAVLRGGTGTGGAPLARDDGGAAGRDRCCPPPARPGPAGARGGGAGPGRAGPSRPLAARLPPVERSTVPPRRPLRAAFLFIFFPF